MTALFKIFTSESICPGTGKCGGRGRGDGSIRDRETGDPQPTICRGPVASFSWSRRS